MESFAQIWPDRPSLGGRRCILVVAAHELEREGYARVIRDPLAPRTNEKPREQVQHPFHNHADKWPLNLDEQPVTPHSIKAHQVKPKTCVVVDGKAHSEDLWKKIVGHQLPCGKVPQ